MILECLFLQLFNLIHGYCQEWNVFHFPSRVWAHLSFLPILIKYGTKITQHFAIQILPYLWWISITAETPFVPQVKTQALSFLDRCYILSCFSSSLAGWCWHLLGCLYFCGERGRVSHSFLWFLVFYLY